MLLLYVSIIYAIVIYVKYYINAFVITEKNVSHYIMRYIK